VIARAGQGSTTARMCRRRGPWIGIVPGSPADPALMPPFGRLPPWIQCSPIRSSPRRTGGRCSISGNNPPEAVQLLLVEGHRKTLSPKTVNYRFATWPLVRIPQFLEQLCDRLQRLATAAFGDRMSVNPEGSLENSANTKLTHNLEVAGSNPVPATFGPELRWQTGPFSLPPFRLFAFAERHFISR
jgi:hypothetical protein